MSLEETLALKETNLEKLIRNADEAIRKEILKYEKAELYIRLQSECFDLYPVVARALSLQIADKKQRSIFCSIVKGHNLERLATYYKQTPEGTAQEFRNIVCELRSKVEKGAFTAKESVNLRLLDERNRLQYEVRYCNEQNKKLQLKVDEQHDQILILRSDLKKKTESELMITSEKELEIRQKIRIELQEEMKKKIEIPTSRHVSIGTRCVRWLKIVYSRL